MRLPKVFYVVNVDWFFLSHRLPLAIEMKNSGYEVYILTKDTGKADEIKKQGLNFINIDFERSGSNPARDLFIIKRLRSIYKQHKPEIIHHVTIKPAIYGSIAAKSLNNTKVFNAISGLGYNFTNGRDGLVQKIVKRLMKFAFNKKVNFIFQNPDDLAMYKSIGLLNNNKYKLIKGAGVDHDIYPHTPPVEKDCMEVIVTARMLLDKGINEFIGAAKLLYDKWNGKARFILMGDTDDHNLSAISESVLKESEIDSYLIWKGFQKNVIPALVYADIVCLPSYREGLPKSLIEAMAIGRPIITTDVPGCRECVEHGYNGLLVPVKTTVELAAAIEQLLEDKAERLRMGNASRAKMEAELSLSKVLSETIAFYNEN